MADPPSVTELRIRSAVRALLLDPDDRVLLVRFEFRTVSVWALPGGGIEPGESDHEALHRELDEEVGLTGATLGPRVWTRLHVIAFLDGSHDGQRDHVYLVRTDAFEPRPRLTWEQLRAEYVHEIRWWTQAELAAAPTGDDAARILFAPRRLPELVARIAAEGPPDEPWDSGI